MSRAQQMRDSAIELTQAACRRVGFSAVRDVVDKFGGKPVGMMDLALLPDFMDAVEALQAPPKTATLPVQFQVGDRVKTAYQTGAVTRVVERYEVTFDAPSPYTGNSTTGVYPAAALTASPAFGVYSISPNPPPKFAPSRFGQPDGYSDLYGASRYAK